MQRLRSFATLGVAALLLLVVVFINGGPIIYPDTLAYLYDADRLAHLHAPDAVRPVFYGLAVWPLHWRGQFGPALFAQALITAHLVTLTARATGATLSAAGLLAAALALALLTPLSWHLAHLLPDVFVSVLILCLYLLAFCSAVLSRGERLYLVLLAAAASSFHLTALPVGAALVVFALFARWTWPGQVRPLLALAPLPIAIAASLALSLAIWHRPTLTPNSPPHLMARLIADGPGRDFLRATCPGSGLELCAYLDRLPPNEDGILWGLLPSVPREDGRRIRAESGAVVRGTIAMFPLAVVGHMLANTAAQFVTIRSETQFGPEEWTAFRQTQPDLWRTVASGRQAKGALDAPALDTINAVHALVACLSALASLPLLVLGLRTGARRPVALIGAVLDGLLANAFACGALGGVFGRYQGRVIWLLPFAVGIAAIALARARSAALHRA